MDKLAEFSKLVYRINVLMGASGMTLAELLASAAEHSVHCEKCPLLKTCDDHDNDGCYFIWLKFLEEGSIE